MHLLAITPGRGFEPGAWAPVLASGVDALLIREPGLGPEALAAAAAWCRAEAPGLALWVRGMALPGCGLHAPEGGELLARPLSRPLHGESQWEARRGADQLLLSPIFATPGKGAPWGPDRLLAFLDGVPEGGPRLLALGGVTPEHASRLRHPRLAGIAAIRPYWAGDPAASVAAFRAAWP